MLRVPSKGQSLLVAWLIICVCVGPYLLERRGHNILLHYIHTCGQQRELRRDGEWGPLLWAQLSLRGKVTQ